MFRTLTCTFALLALVACVRIAAAQSIGTFRWQLQPYCNVVTLAVAQNGGVFEIQGTDDQCGASKAASASGTAYFNPDGSIGFGLAIVAAPSGAPVHVEASISLSTLSGTWHDSTGASGSFVFTPGRSSGGSPRPAITVGLSGVTLGFGLVSGDGDESASLRVNLDQVKAGLDIRTPEEASVAVGQSALSSAGADAGFNTAFGSQALRSLNGGTGNTAVGADAMILSTTSTFNTAVGLRPLSANLTGNSNAAFGALALTGNTTGNDNVAVGAGALALNNAGSGNVAVGHFAGFAVEGGSNVAVGDRALGGAGPGARNVAIGSSALEQGQGNDNIVVGHGAGSAIPQFANNSNNIYIGSGGAAADNHTIRIGNDSHTATFIAGIRNQAITGTTVSINSAGKMGVSLSSIRYKTDVVPLGEDEARRVHHLEPVRFLYKPEYDDGTRQVQFGLIAEEVAKTFPELAVFDEQGRPETVRYQLLIPLLLGEVQRLERERHALTTEVEHLKKIVTALGAGSR